MQPTVFTEEQLGNQAYILANVTSATRSPEWPDCWEWQAGLTDAGYGRSLKGPGRSDKAYRTSFCAFVGEIPEGLEPDHLCYNKLCVNPSHLELVTRRENVRRSIEHHRAQGTGNWNRLAVCTKGLHEMSPDNVYVRVTPKKTFRSCKACARATHQRFVEANPDRVALHQARRQEKLTKAREQRTD